MAGAAVTEDLPALIDALCEVYDDTRFRMKIIGGGKVTYCNQVVQYVARRMGYDGFAGRMANGMIDFMSLGGEWVATDFEKAQIHANLGRLVVAGLKNEPHGHVVVVRPGKPILANTAGS